jgi:hypothetical protein
VSRVAALKVFCNVPASQATLPASKGATAARPCGGLLRSRGALGSCNATGRGLAHWCASRAWLVVIRAALRRCGGPSGARHTTAAAVQCSQRGLSTAACRAFRHLRMLGSPTTASHGPAACPSSPQVRAGQRLVCGRLSAHAACRMRLLGRACTSSRHHTVCCTPPPKHNTRQAAAAVQASSHSSR